MKAENPGSNPGDHTNFLFPQHSPWMSGFSVSLHLTSSTTSSLTNALYFVLDLRQDPCLPVV